MLVVIVLRAWEIKGGILYRVVVAALGAGAQQWSYAMKLQAPCKQPLEFPVSVWEVILASLIKFF